MLSERKDVYDKLKNTPRELYEYKYKTEKLSTADKKYKRPYR